MRLHAIDPFSDATIQDPYAFYAALRDEAPVYRAAGGQYWYVSRYEDIERVVMDPQTYSSHIVAILLESDGAVQVVDKPTLDVGPVDVLAIEDPPAHGPQRTAITRVLNRRTVRALEDGMRSKARRMLDEGGTSMDFMAAVAFRLPMEVISDLLGLPREMAPQLKEWSDHAIALLSGVNTAEQLSDHIQASLAYTAWLTRWCERPPTTPLMAALAEGDFTPREVMSMVMQLVIAGSDSSASAMGSAVRMLAESPTLQATLRADPTRIPAFIDEVLRLETPFQGHFRCTTREVELGGTTLPAGARLMVLWASGNRDPAAWSHPDRVDLDRPNGARHLAFGHGLHRCLGAQLARLEAKVVVEEALQRCGSITLDTASLRYRPSVFVRTLEALPIRLATAAPQSKDRPSASSA